MASLIWTEKYRPQDFSDIRGQNDIVKTVQALVEKKNLPHLLFSGPAGIGKTTLSLIIAKKLFGDAWKNNFLELNASDDRGIDVVRNTIKDFAKTRAIGDFPFKIIYLDECLGYNSEIIISAPEGKEKVKIGDFIEKYNPKEVQVLSVDDNGEKTFVGITGVMKIPHRPEEGFYKLKTHDKEIELTGNHLLITPNGWKPVKELKIGELVLCPLPENNISANTSERAVDYTLVGLPKEIRKKEHYITNSPEKQIIELLACNRNGLNRREITNLSGIASPKLTSILSEKKNEYYIPLLHYDLICKEKDKFKLKDDKNKTLSNLYKIKREQNIKNQMYITGKLAYKGLFPLKKDKALIAARIAGHLFSDGCLSLKTKQLFFSGKEEDLKKIKLDVNALGFNILGNIRHNKWKNGECWSFGAYNIELLSLFYSLGIPVGKKTDTYYLIPDWIVGGSKEIQKEFLASFFGGEGSNPKFQERNIKPIVFAQSKRDDLKENLINYLNQFRDILIEFGVDCNIKVSDKVKNTRKDNTKTIEGKLSIKNSRKNIIRFLENIGYVYCHYKEDMAKSTLQYLRWKESLGKGVYTFRPVPHFDKWKREYVIGESSYNYITEINKLPEPDYVYCIATSNQKFIANDIIVHNCDSLTKDAQQALRRTMENFVSGTRFILSCNYSSKIIDAIQSRCAVFRFKPLADEELLKVADAIAVNEGMKLDEGAKKALALVSEGDVRKLVNVMQSCAALGNNITESSVFNISSLAEPKEIIEVLNAAVKGDFTLARGRLLDVQMKYGLSGIDLIKQIQKEVWKLNINDKEKLRMVERCGEIEFRMVEGSDEFVQLEALIASFITK